MNNELQEERNAWLRLVGFVNARDAIAVAEDDATLKTAGVDVGAATTTARAVVRRTIQQHMRQQAAQEREVSDTTTAGVNEVLSWSAAKMQQWLDDAVGGLWGARLQHLAQPCYRNKHEDGLTEKEMRTLLMDISKAVGKLPDRQ